MLLPLSILSKRLTTELTIGLAMSAYISYTEFIIKPHLLVLEQGVISRNQEAVVEAQLLNMASNRNSYHNSVEASRLERILSTMTVPSVDFNCTDCNISIKGI